MAENVIEINLNAKDKTGGTGGPSSSSGASSSEPLVRDLAMLAAAYRTPTFVPPPPPTPPPSPPQPSMDQYLKAFEAGMKAGQLQTQGLGTYYQGSAIDRGMPVNPYKAEGYQTVSKVDRERQAFEVEQQQRQQELAKARAARGLPGSYDDAADRERRAKLGADAAEFEKRRLVDAKNREDAEKFRAEMFAENVDRMTKSLRQAQADAQKFDSTKFITNVGYASLAVREFGSALQAASAYTRATASYNAAVIGNDAQGAKIAALEQKQAGFDLAGTAAGLLAGIGTLIATKSPTAALAAGYGAKYAVGGAPSSLIDYFKSQEEAIAKNRDAYRSRTDQLAPYSGELSRVQADRQVGQINRDIAESKVAGPALAQVEREQQRLDATNQQLLTAQKILLANQQSADLQKQNQLATAELNKKLDEIAKTNKQMANDIRNAFDDSDTADPIDVLRRKAVFWPDGQTSADRGDIQATRPGRLPLLNQNRRQ